MAKKKAKNKKGRMAAAICRLFGCAILIMVIAALLPMTIPRLMGYEVYNVISGSMEPEIPIWSIAFVKPIDPVELEQGDIIAFMSGGSVVMHRVKENYKVEGYLITKGDANEQEDLAEIQYDMVIGIVVKHFPYLGQLMMLLSSNIAKALMMCLALCGALLNILASRIKDVSRNS